MNLEEYKTELQSMDWYYDFSDDHRVWRAGHARKRFLERVAKQSTEHTLAWDEVQQQLHDGTFVRRGSLWRKEEA